MTPTLTGRDTAKLQEREDFIRESWVKAMEARLVRDELVKCQRHEGVNSLENCRWLSEKYAQMLIENRVRRSVPREMEIDQYPRRVRSRDTRKLMFE